MMEADEVFATRRSVRAFTQHPVAPSLVREILERAARAPSGSNLQPWKVYALTGQARDALVRRVRERMVELPHGETPEYPIHPPGLTEPYRSRYARSAKRAFDTLGIRRDDALARQRHLARNWDFFGAPVGLIFTIDRQMGPGQWMDLGMYLQNLMLLARTHGLDTCAQEAWALWPTLVYDCLGIPAQEMLVCGMALGHADPAAPINGLVSERVPFDEYARVLETL